ncbi:hypothetical protein GCM10010213_25860 [Microbacterium maritypicum]|uniref:Uncharacterized protein n=1 Tax=Microbacterium maritypicum TaxID=33918 RepID=A0A4Y4BD51_MICMQ|nr:hypothetical protein MLI01_28620 [Microbacterium liquefaciens]GGV61857.1 hypothetical protein GCM10010213_25860 [Microbacterium liquefaciens]
MHAVLRHPPHEYGAARPRDRLRLDEQRLGPQHLVRNPRRYGDGRAGILPRTGALQLRLRQVDGTQLPVDLCARTSDIRLQQYR